MISKEIDAASEGVLCNCGRREVADDRGVGVRSTYHSMHSPDIRRHGRIKLKTRVEDLREIDAVGSQRATTVVTCSRAEGVTHPLPVLFMCLFMWFCF